MRKTVGHVVAASLFLLAVSALAASEQGSASTKEAASSIAYVAEAISALREKTGMSIRVEQGWTIANDVPEYTLWSFTPEGHPAHPSAVKRSVIRMNGAIHIMMSVLCEAEKPACDDLVEEFEMLNKQMSDPFNGDKR